MPNSPKVDFKIENNNLERSTPLAGVSHVVALTTKGNPNDPSELISSIGQFNSIFGNEIVPDGSLSNIEVALRGGSILRVAKVGSSTRSKALASLAEISGEEGQIGELVAVEDAEDHHLNIPLVIRIGDKFAFLNMRSKGYGISVGESPDYSPKYGIKFSLVAHAGLTTHNELVMKVYKTLDTNDFNAGTLLATKTVTWFSNSTVTSGNEYFDLPSFQEFINNNGYVDVEFVYLKNGAEFNDETHMSVTSLSSLYDYVVANWDANSNFYNELSPLAIGDNFYAIGDIGSAGGTITVDDWKAAYESLKEYTDAYQVACSHVHQHLSTQDLGTLHKYIGEDVTSLQEAIYYIEVPKYNTDLTPKDNLEIKEWVAGMVANVGNSMMVAYFAGGYKYYNKSSILVECDNLGTVLALGDSAASNYGPWLHFSGQNRGMVINSRGTVSPNYGSRTNYDKLNIIANAMCNMAVVREIPGYGHQVMLAHNFTSQLRTDSFRYLGVVRLCLFIKKNLVPMLNNYLEEPNTFSTWKTMYYEIRPILERLVEKGAIVSYDYQGDQNATSFKELQVNNEADVRQGKYKVKLSIIEVVALQEIGFTLSIDKVGNVTVNF